MKCIKMTDMLEQIAVDAAVWELRPDFAVLRRGPRQRSRQCLRTRMTESTKNALFLLERLEPYSLRLDAAGDALAARLRAISPGVRIESRLIEPI